MMKQRGNTANLKPWKPGQSGNPLGRLLARERSSQRRSALTHWRIGRPTARDTLERVRKDDPSNYLRVLFSIIPKDIAVSIEKRTGPMDTAEMQDAPAGGADPGDGRCSRFRDRVRLDRGRFAGTCCEANLTPDRCEIRSASNEINNLKRSCCIRVAKASILQVVTLVRRE